MGEFEDGEVQTGLVQIEREPPDGAFVTAEYGNAKRFRSTRERSAKSRSGIGRRYVVALVLSRAARARISQAAVTKFEISFVTLAKELIEHARSRPDAVLIITEPRDVGDSV